MNVAAIDFETYYDEHCSIRPLGTYAYLHHPDYEAYLVSIVTSGGFEWCGHPKDAPWEIVCGPGWTWVSHNAGFDEPVFRLLQEQRIVCPDFNPEEWHCTADLCAFLAAPRALAAACHYLYGEKISKDVRTKMKGKRWQNLSDDAKKEVLDYALVDSRKCLRFWMDHGESWPVRERRLSAHTRRMCQRGMLADAARLQEGIDLLSEIAWRAGAKIPWHGRAKDLSYPALVAECRKEGIDAPSSLAMDSEDCAEWEKKYGEQFVWVDAMRAKRRTNALLKKLETIQLRIQPNGRAGYGLKYFGAHTGRWSGDAGWNPQNISQGEMFGEEWFLGPLRADGTRDSFAAEGRNFAEMWQPGMRGVDLRKCFLAPEGHHYNIADLSQIEPRVLWELAGDYDSLSLVKDGMSPYEAHARTTMGWDKGSLKKQDPEWYRLAKARVLALGYGAGFLKFIVMARNYDAEACFDAPVTRKDAGRFLEFLEFCQVSSWTAMWNKGSDRACRTMVNSWKIVMDFRRTNPKIVALWRKYGHQLKQAVYTGELIIPLPSGRSLKYRGIYESEGEIHGTVIKSGRPQDVRLYGALIVENIVQAVSRDVFAEGLLRLEDAGIATVVHIHDESVTECALSVPPETVGSLLSQAPDWLPHLPVSSEAASSPYYTK